MKRSTICLLLVRDRRRRVAKASAAPPASDSPAPTCRERCLPLCGLRAEADAGPDRIPRRLQVDRGPSSVSVATHRADRRRKSTRATSVRPEPSSPARPTIFALPHVDRRIVQRPARRHIRGDRARGRRSLSTVCAREAGRSLAADLANLLAEHLRHDLELCDLGQGGSSTVWPSRMIVTRSPTWWSSSSRWEM